MFWDPLINMTPFSSLRTDSADGSVSNLLSNVLDANVLDADGKNED